MSDFISNSEGYTTEYFGLPINRAGKVIILLPGRRQDAEDIYKQVAEKIALPDVSWVIPSAPGKTWYPRGFMRAEADNQPHLDRAIAHLDSLFSHLLKCGKTWEQIWIMGFSQGACIAARYLASTEVRLKGAVLFTGGLFGPKLNLEFDNSTIFEGMLVILTGSHTDTWVPADRIVETAQYFRKCGAEVIEKIYRERDHAVCDDEVAIAKRYIL